VTLTSRSAVSAVLVSVLVFADSIAGASDGGREPITLGHSETFRSAILTEDRRIEISLPIGFETSEETYPLVVVLDGGDLFLSVVASTKVLTPNYFPEMVIVGVPNTNRNRDLDVTGAEGSDSDAFQAFLENELIPYLVRQYRASGYRVLMGHSLAGLFSLHASLRHPTIYDASISTSPSLPYEGALAKIEEALDRPDPTALTDHFVYMSAGGEEPAVLQDRISDVERRLAELDINGLVCETDVFEGEGHFPNKGFYQGLRSAFGDWGIPTEWFVTGTLDQLEEHYQRAAAKYGAAPRPPSDLIWSLRRRLEELGLNDEHLAATEYHVAQYPSNLARYLVLADLYVDRSETAKAIEILEEGLLVDPGADQLRIRLVELQKEP